MKKLFFVFICISKIALAYDLLISCEKKEPDIEFFQDFPTLRCDLKNKENGEEVGYITSSYWSDDKTLHIDYIKINDKFKLRDLSSVLLYHVVKTAAKDYFKDIENLQLADDSSIRHEKGIEQYKRYGFKKIGTESNIYEMKSRYFLNKTDNLRRYYSPKYDNIIEEK